MKLNRSKNSGKKGLSIKSDELANNYAFATGLAQKGRFAEAELELKKIVKSMPGHDAAKNLLSIIYAHLGKFDNALFLNAKLLENNRTNAEYHFNRGIILYQSNNKKEAITSFERTLKFKQDHVGAYLYLGLIFKENGELDKSLGFYQKSIEINPNIPESFFNCAMIYSVVGRPDQAIESFGHAVGLNPKYTEAFYYLGNELLTQGRIDEALKAYSTAIEIDPECQMAFYNIGNIFLKKGELSDAISAYEKCLGVNPKHDMALLNIGNVYLERGDISIALDFYQRCLAATPENKSYNYLMVGNSLHHKGLYDESIVAYKACLTIDPENVPATFNLGNVLQKIGDLREARTAFEATLKKEPFHIGALTNYALMEHSDGDKVKAKELFEKIVELDQDNAQAKHMLNALQGITPATAPPSEYIAALFDQYSTDFEEHLINLAYKVPTVLREELDLIVKGKNKFNKTIDLGCGTGLSGIDFREITHYLSGIDISPKMIKEARKKNIYDELIVGSHCCLIKLQMNSNK